MIDVEVKTKNKKGGETRGERQEKLAKQAEKMSEEDIIKVLTAEQRPEEEVTVIYNNELRSRQAEAGQFSKDKATLSSPDGTPPVVHSEIYHDRQGGLAGTKQMIEGLRDEIRSMPEQIAQGIVAGLAPMISALKEDINPKKK